MRGSRCDLEDGGGAEAGINPAYAGNTFALTAFSHAFRDQPRVCGEYNVCLDLRRGH